jgi:hypothetical protein
MKKSGDYKFVETTNLWRLQICVVSKSRHYKLCNENRQAPQTFIVSKSGHYKLCNENRHPSQTFVASKSGHYRNPVGLQ